MDTFGFTRKKFLSLAEKARHRHLILWLTGFYQKLVTNRVKADAFEDFFCRYETLLKWMDSPLPRRPGQGTRRAIEYVSNAIHTHRQASGLILRDHMLLEPMTLEDRRVRPAQSMDFHYQVALDGLRSLFNVGSIFRTCDGAGVDTVILGNTLGKEHPHVRKTAMGTQEWIQEERTSDLALTLAEKKGQGYAVIGVETMAGSIACHEYAWPQKAVLVFGNEEYGISSHVMETVDAFVHIPMFGRKNSLNVANAVAIVLFQAIYFLTRKS